RWHRMLLRQPAERAGAPLGKTRKRAGMDRYGRLRLPQRHEKYSPWLLLGGRGNFQPASCPMTASLIEKLLAMPGRGVKTFDAFQRLDRTLGSPHRAFRSVHVGGTNGKGSVATKIAEGLRAEGFRVGL